MKIIKIRLWNYKKFEFLNIDFKGEKNILIGDNESGKSSILQAIDLVLSGSKAKIENIGLDCLFNTSSIETFFATNTVAALPRLIIEVFFDEIDDIEFWGKNNSYDANYCGISLICSPREDVGKELSEILMANTNNFPYEYYTISFYKFSGIAYLGFRKYFKHLLLDNTLINNEYATNQYIKTLYTGSVTSSEKNKHSYEYRNHKLNFRDNILGELNKKTGLEKYQFSIRNNTKSNLETDLTITEQNVEIQNRGKGRQCFIKTEFALQKNEHELDFILLEEPENHLSHIHMHNLIERIGDSKNKQLFIATHSNKISSRLDLRNCILLNNNSKVSVGLNDLSESTAKFFIKAPDSNILEFILSSKVILVEGDAEYILIEKFFEGITGYKPHQLNVHVISVGGTSFKRYLEIANLLGIKTAFIRDNDGDYIKNCEENYFKFFSKNVQLFSEKDNDLYTFEVSMYQTNIKICNELFGPKLQRRTVQQYMLDEKTESAYELLLEKSDLLIAPQYIIESILWLTKD
jgi:putative ATP-dependent endonuclease of the OLD family